MSLAAPRRRVARRVALAVTAILVTAGVAQLAAAGLIAQRETLAIREELLTVGLRMLRLAEQEQKLSADALARELADLPGFSVVTYDERGRRIASSRSDVSAPELLDSAVLGRAKSDPDRAVALESSSLGRDNVGLIAVPAARGTVAYVGLFDRWTPRRIDRAFIQGLVGGLAVNVLIGFLATLVLARRVGRGVARAERVVERMAEGELGVRLTPQGDDEIGRLARSFNRMADRLEQQVEQLRREQETRRRAFADWTHELATPLSSVLGYLESLELGGLDEPTRRRYLTTAFEQATAVRALSDDLTTLARLELEGLRLDRGRVDLVALAESETRALAREAEGRQVELVLDRTEPLEIEADRQRLGQVLRNLLSNALRHTPVGRAVRVRVLCENDRAVLEVADEGEGISPADLEQLGERFYRADPSRDRRTGGRGLGLRIARGIVEAHAGTLAISSQLGKGTVARVELPLTFTKCP
jgi:signal transduction histidine kinase